MFYYTIDTYPKIMLSMLCSLLFCLYFTFNVSPHFHRIYNITLNLQKPFINTNNNFLQFYSYQQVTSLKWLREVTYYLFFLFFLYSSISRFQSEAIGIDALMQDTVSLTALKFISVPRASGS